MSSPRAATSCDELARIYRTQSQQSRHESQCTETAVIALMVSFDRPSGVVSLSIRAPPQSLLCRECTDRHGRLPINLPSHCELRFVPQFNRVSIHNDDGWYKGCHCFATKEVADDGAESKSWRHYAAHGKPLRGLVSWQSHYCT